MKCEMAQQRVVMAIYGELPDEWNGPLERHLTECEECRRELNAIRALDEYLAQHPVLEPSPNFLAQSRVRLDEALDRIPPHGFLTRLRVNFYNWLGHMQGAPALMTLLLGVGFLGGNFTYRYQAAHLPKEPADFKNTHYPQESIANITGIIPTAKERVQVMYNKVVPETMEGSLDSPEIRRLLLVGMAQATNPEVHESSVNLLSKECKAGHACVGNDGNGIRGALLVSLRYDKSPEVRMKALEGLQPYVSQDQRVRDTILESILHDRNAAVRIAAIGLMAPVQSDSSVRQVLRTVSARDESPYIRNASFNALQGAADIQ